MVTVDEPSIPHSSQQVIISVEQNFGKQNTKNGNKTEKNTLTKKINIIADFTNCGQGGYLIIIYLMSKSEHKRTTLKG